MLPPDEARTALYGALLDKAEQDRKEQKAECEACECVRGWKCTTELDIERLMGNIHVTPIRDDDESRVGYRAYLAAKPHEFWSSALHWRRSGIEAMRPAAAAGAMQLSAISR